MKLKNIYNFENEKAVIELMVYSLDQLFDKRDPNPFLKKDLDDDASDYIVSSAVEIGQKKIGKLKIYVESKNEIENKGIIENSIHKYFDYRVELNRRRIKNILKIGIKSLIIGLVFFSFSIFLSRLISDFETSSFMNTFFKEGFILLGWVSMWKPVNIFLYDWWPLIEQQNILRSLSRINIELVYGRDEI